MALRNIRKDEDSVLYRNCRPYTEFNERLWELLDDMGETMTDASGVGLAAPQVGILRRCCVVLETNVAEDEEEYIIELVNPEIIEADGEQTGWEGCLSFPGLYGSVTRPDHVVVKAQDRFGKEFTVEGVGLTARAFCHEIDHLSGHVFKELSEELLTEEELQERFAAEEEDFPDDEAAED
ncbi:MAG: peptide deformylase [Clostridiales bacterium]|nr:peptide deformylase [Candidatus Apopatocola equi]MCQ2438235.1 peptide deformylase [Oscillospiraceae bacterium]